MVKTGTKLNIGCGAFPKAGWVNIDIAQPPDAYPDVIASILKLPVVDDVASHIYLGHVLDQLKLKDVPKALAEVRRVLHPMGVVMIVGGGESCWRATEAEMVTQLHGAEFHVVPIPISVVPRMWPSSILKPWMFAAVARRPEAVALRRAA